MATVVLATQADAQSASLTIRILSDCQPVEAAEVTTGSLRQLTDDSGEAVLALPTGAHALRVTRVGYAAAEIDLVLVAGADTTVVVELEEEAIETEGIVVVSSRTERRIEDEPLRLEVVSRGEVEEKVLMTPGDISVLLNETVGLPFRSMGFVSGIVASGLFALGLPLVLDV